MKNSKMCIISRVMQKTNTKRKTKTTTFIFILSRNFDEKLLLLKRRKFERIEDIDTPKNIGKFK